MKDDFFPLKPPLSIIVNDDRIIFDRTHDTHSEKKGFSTVRARKRWLNTFYTRWLCHPNSSHNGRLLFFSLIFSSFAFRLPFHSLFSAHHQKVEDQKVFSLFIIFVMLNGIFGFLMGLVHSVTFTIIIFIFSWYYTEYQWYTYFDPRYPSVNLMCHSSWAVVCLMLQVEAILALAVSMVRRSQHWTWDMHSNTIKISQILFEKFYDLLRNRILIY